MPEDAGDNGVIWEADMDFKEDASCCHQQKYLTIGMRFHLAPRTIGFAYANI
jgi:hypothetical protein